MLTAEELSGRRRTSVELLTVLALCVVQIVGCMGSGQDRQTAPVTGKVTYHGKPLSHGQVVMIHDSGPLAAGEIRSDGSYQVEAIVGSNHVMILCTDIPNVSEIDPKAGLGVRLPKSLIPAKYTDYVSSGFTIDVVEGSNTADWTLVD